MYPRIRDLREDKDLTQKQIGELLNGPNQIYCNTCGGMTDALMVNYMNTSPEVLTIILNRGKGLEFNVDFHFDHYINIDNYVLDKSNKVVSFEISNFTSYTFVTKSFCSNLTSYTLSFKTNPSSVLVSCISYTPIGSSSTFKFPSLSRL